MLIIGSLKHLFYPEDRSSRVLRNVFTYSPNYTAPHTVTARCYTQPRRLNRVHSSYNSTLHYRFEHYVSIQLGIYSGIVLRGFSTKLLRAFLVLPIREPTSHLQSYLMIYYYNTLLY